MAQKYYCRDFFENGENVSIGFYLEHRYVNMHSHEFWELSYVYEGRGTHHSEDGSSTAVSEGSFIFISPCVSHCITSPRSEKDGWVRVCNMLMTQDYIDALMRHLASLNELDEYDLRGNIIKKEPFCLHLRDDSGIIYNLLVTAAHEYRHRLNGSRSIIENTALSLLTYIMRLHEHSITDEAVSIAKNDLVNDLIRFIGSNFGNDLSLDYLAAYVHLSPEYLSRYFKKHTGVNISDFITKTRIEKAKYRLRTSDWTINDICEYCGYGSLSSFQKAFKKAVGMTAGEYRQYTKQPF